MLPPMRRFAAPKKGQVYLFKDTIPANGLLYSRGTASHYDPDHKHWWFQLTPPTEDDPGLSVWWHNDDLADHVHLVPLVGPAGSDDNVSIEEFVRRLQG